MTMNIFEKATKQKVRFNYKGSISVEQLWDVSITGLNSIYESLSAQEQEQSKGKSLLETNTTDEELTLKMDLVKHVFTYKKGLQDAAKLAKEKAEKRQEIMQLITQKEQEELKGRSKDELLKMLEAIG